MYVGCQIQASLDLVKYNSLSFQSQLSCEGHVCGLFAGFESAVTRFRALHITHALRTQLRFCKKLYIQPFMTPPLLKD